jgi:porin
VNENFAFRRSEVMLEAYYQMNVVDHMYVQPTVMYVPSPGQSRSLPPAIAIAMLVTFLF